MRNFSKSETGASHVMQRIHSSPSWLNEWSKLSFFVGGLAVFLSSALPYRAQVPLAYVVNVFLRPPQYYLEVVRTFFFKASMFLAGFFFYFGFLGIFKLVWGMRKLEPADRELRKNPAFFKML